MVGISVAAVMANANHLFDQIYPDDRAAYQVAAQHSLETLTPFDHQWRIITLAGEIKWLQGRSQPRRRPNGDTAWYGVVIDISDLKRIEAERQQIALELQRSLDQLMATQAALQISEMQLSGVLNSSLDGIVAFRACRDESGHIFDFEGLISNPAACELLRLTAGTLVGHNMLQVLPGNKTSGIFDHYVQVVKTGDPHRQEIYYPYDNIDGWYEVVAVKLGDGIAVTFRNITRLKQSELALQAANQRLGQQVDLLNQRNAEMRRLGGISNFLQACPTADAAYDALANLLAPLFPDCGGGLLLVAEASAEGDAPMTAVAHWGPTPNSTARFVPSRCLALQQGCSYRASPTQSTQHCCHLSGLNKTQTTFCVPMSTQGETLGLLYLHSANPEALDEAKGHLANTVADHLALALANLHLRETLRYQSIRDPLTGLYNRRYLEESLTQELISAQRHRHPIGVIMLDLDHFKVFNDTYGHDAGDRALQAVAHLLTDSVRGSDIACRYGGEEITLVLPGSSLAETQARAEEIRRAIAALNLPETNAALTASLGVACFPEHGTTLRGLIKAADQAMYQAKQEGRDRVVAA
jgi:diguanylate cyclase (GGDEF)-like protein